MVAAIRGSFAGDPEGFQRNGTQRFVLVHFIQTLIGQQVVFQNSFASSLFGLAALIPALSTPTNGLDGLPLKVGSSVTP